MKLHFFKKLLLPPYFLFVFYVISCKIIGDHYPFARYDMYSTIPSYAYSFYITDENGEPLDDFFKDMRNLLVHQYYSSCEKHRYRHGYEQETDEQLHIVGEEMLEATLNNTVKEKYRLLNVLCLYRINFFMENGKIKINEKFLFEKVLD